MGMVVLKEEYEQHREEYLRKIATGAVFVYPTDTIYGIGCDATSSIAVEKLRLIKERYKKPFSVIASNKDWIRHNCIVHEDYLDKLPGPYTLIIKLKKPNAVSPLVNPDMHTIGVRIPNHWCSEIATLLNIPIVTTSANIVGHNFMTSLANLSHTIKSKDDFILYEGPLEGRPSTILDLTKEKLEVIKR